jgi:acyl-CoA reductase-like NAD-dependent aldehyde dehydrogenase
MNDFDRQKLLLKFADLIEANQEYLASLTRVTLGAPYKPFGKSEIDTAIGCFRCESRAGDYALIDNRSRNGRLCGMGGQICRAELSKHGRILQDCSE